MTSDPKREAPATIDFAAAGLLDGLPDDRARSARLQLLSELARDGVSLDELRNAVAQDRLAELSVERIVTGDDTFTALEVARLADVDIEDLTATFRALGFSVPAPDERVFDEDDVEAARRIQAFDDSGLPREARLEVARVIGRGLAEIAAAMRFALAESFAQPGASELERARTLAEAARLLLPQTETTLSYVLEHHLREQARQDVAGAAGLGGREIAIAFADLVGFTRLGEELAPEQIGALGRRFGELANEVAAPPVRLIKMIGDAAMLASFDGDATLDAALALVAAADGEGAGFPQLRAGVAWGEAVGRAGDWYGRPVNLASRVTGIARPGSVVVTEPLRDRASEGFRFSFAGKRRIKGIRDEVKLYRARRGDRPAAGSPRAVG